MLDLDLTHLLAAKGGRPLSVAALVSAVFRPSSLLIYFTRPDLFARFGTAGGLLFGAACGFPIVLACSCPWYALYWGASQVEKIEKRVLDAVHNKPDEPEASIAEQVTVEDPFEWPTLLLGGWTANLVLYILVAIAYYRPILLGATLLRTAAIALGVWFLVATVFFISVWRQSRKADRTIESINKARLPAQPR